MVIPSSIDLTSRFILKLHPATPSFILPHSYHHSLSSILLFIPSNPFKLGSSHPQIKITFNPSILLSVIIKTKSLSSEIPLELRQALKLSSPPSSFLPSCASISDLLPRLPNQLTQEGSAWVWRLLVFDTHLQILLALPHPSYLGRPAVLVPLETGPVLSKGIENSIDDPPVCDVLDHCDRDRSKSKNSSMEVAPDVRIGGDGMVSSEVRRPSGSRRSSHPRIERS